MIPLSFYLLLSAMIFGLSLAGIIINRQNVIRLLICLELMLLAININFVAFSHFMGSAVGQVFVFFILTVAAAEAAIGLAIVVVVYRQKGCIEITKLDELKG